MLAVALFFLLLIGPFVIDWTLYRGMFERYGSTLLGHRVQVIGRVDVRLLPAPRILLTQMRIGEGETPLADIERFEMQLDLPPLLQGAVQIVDMQIEAPRFNLGLDEAGRLDWLIDPAGRSHVLPFDPAHVHFENITIRDGAVRLVDARNGRVMDGENLNLNISARSLEGPFRLEGDFMAGGENVRLRAASGMRSGEGTIPLNVRLASANASVEAELDGVLGYRGGVLAYQGTASLASLNADGTVNTGLQGDNVWQGAGRFSVDSKALSIEEAQIFHGPPGAPVGLSFSARIDWEKKPVFNVEAFGERVDLDRLQHISSGQIAPGDASPHRFFSRLLPLAGAMPRLAMEGRLALDIATVIAGRQITENFQLITALVNERWNIERLAAKLPGEGQIEAGGTLYTGRRGNDVKFNGALDLKVADAGLLADWWRGNADRAGPQEERLTGFDVAPLGQLALRSRLELSAQRIAFQEVNWRGLNSDFTGNVTIREIHAARPVLVARLAGERIDFDRMAALAGRFSAMPANIRAENITSAMTRRLALLSLYVTARELRLGGMTAKNFLLDSSISPRSITIVALGAEDFEGARLSASGALRHTQGGPDGELKASVSFGPAARFGELILPLIENPWLREKTAHAIRHFDATQLALTLSASGAAGTPRTALSIAGTLGRTDLSADLDLTARADAPATDSRQSEVVRTTNAQERSAQSATGAAGPGDFLHDNIFSRFLDWRGRLIDGRLHLANESGADFYSGLGIDVPAGQTFGPVSVTIHGDGRMDDVLDMRLRLTSPEMKVFVIGAVGPPATGSKGADGRDRPAQAVRPPPGTAIAASLSAPVFSGELIVNIVDPAIDALFPGSLSALAQAGMAREMETSIEADRTAIRLKNMQGSIAGNRLTGHVEFPAPWSSARAQRPLLSGDLNFAQTTFDDIAALVLGYGHHGPGQAIDSARPFTDLEGPDFDTKLVLRSDSFDTGGPLRGQGLEMELARMAGETRLSVSSLAVEGADLALTANLVRSGSGGIRLAGTWSLKGADLARFFSRLELPPGLAGMARANGRLVSGGRSLQALASSLSGEGIVYIDKGYFAQLNPHAFAELVAAVDDGRVSQDAVQISQAFADLLAAGRFDLDGVASPFTLDSGRLSFNRLSLPGQAAGLSARIGLDLQARMIDAQFDLDPKNLPDADSGLAVASSIAIKGPWQAPQRVVDIDSLISFLEIRGQLRQIEQLENARKESQVRLEGVSSQPPALQEAEAIAGQDAGKAARDGENGQAGQADDAAGRAIIEDAARAPQSTGGPSTGEVATGEVATGEASEEADGLSPQIVPPEVTLPEVTLPEVTSQLAPGRPATFNTAGVPQN